MKIEEIIKKARELDKEATPGEWFDFTNTGIVSTWPSLVWAKPDWRGVYTETICDYQKPGNAKLIAFARSNIIALCDEIERLRVALDKNTATRFTTTTPDGLKIEAKSKSEMKRLWVQRGYEGLPNFIEKKDNVTDTDIKTETDK